MVRKADRSISKIWNAFSDLLSGHRIANYKAEIALLKLLVFQYLFRNKVKACICVVNIRERGAFIRQLVNIRSCIRSHFLAVYRNAAYSQRSILIVPKRNHYRIRRIIILNSAVCSSLLCNRISKLFRQIGTHVNRVVVEYREVDRSICFGSNNRAILFYARRTRFCCNKEAKVAILERFVDCRVRFVNQFLCSGKLNACRGGIIVLKLGSSYRTANVCSCIVNLVTVIVQIR